MEKLKQDLDKLNGPITELEIQIQKAETEAENNCKKLKIELAQTKQDKKEFAMKNDFDSVLICRRKENNLKFKIDSQWNEYFLLTEELHELTKQKSELERQIKLEEDKIKRINEMQNQMDEVLKNYKKTQNLKQAAIDSNINYYTVKHWFNSGKNNSNEIYVDFYNQIIEIDDYFKDFESQNLKNKMDSVIECYRKTNSLKEASNMANVSYNTVQYWYEWGSKGFGKENTYFFKKLKL